LQRLYLDTNVYCRPRDDRRQKRIDREAKVLEEIAFLKKRGKVCIITSDYVKLEPEEIDDTEKREDIANIERLLADKAFSHSESAKKLAVTLSERCKLGILDVFHISAAALSRAEYFLTCDDEVIKKRECIGKELRHMKIKILNPVEWRSEVD